MALYKQLSLNRKSTVNSIHGVDNDMLLIYDEECFLEVPDKSLQEIFLDKNNPDKVKLFAKPITDSLKRVGIEECIVENLNRNQYLELYTPLICELKHVEKYFVKFKFWSLLKFVNLNKNKIDYQIL